MGLAARFRRTSLRWKLLWSYLIILGAGGLVTSLVGSYIVSSTFMGQARHAVRQHLATARTIYDHELEEVERTVRLGASGTTITQYLEAGDTAGLTSFFDRIRTSNDLDFLTLTDRAGRVTFRSTRPASRGDDVSALDVVRAALAGEASAGTVILTARELAQEDTALLARARLHLVRTPRAPPPQRPELTSGMVLMAAAPVTGADGDIRGTVYAGVLLNRNFEIVDEVWNILYRGERFKGKDVGSVTIFQGDYRISTTVWSAPGSRALGTRVSEVVSEAVLERGETWNDRAFVVNDWYIAAYEPILSLDGDIIGILYVGVLDAVYSSIRNRVILWFFVLATAGFILIIAITDYMIRNITRPIGEMVAATERIAAGNFEQTVRSTSQGEISLLADSFNTMLKSLRQMKADLEEWGATLEEKVKERSEELVAMQARVAQSERLASLGMLSAGVAHEINNPLGGVLSLTMLTLEDMEGDDPRRENLEEVVRQSERCRDIVKGLLEFSRQSEVGTERVNVTEVLDDTISLVSRQAMFFNIELIKDYAAEPLDVIADRSQLQQVFMNMIMNSVQAMDEKGSLTLTTRRTSDGCVEILLCDTGRGIPSEDIDRIFDPFYSTKPAGEGTGLGLSIAYGIVTKHHGTIHVESAVGRGTTFTIRLAGALSYAATVGTSE